MLKAVSKDVLQPFAGELRPVFSAVKGLRNPLYILAFGHQKMSSGVIPRQNANVMENVMVPSFWIKTL